MCHKQKLVNTSFGLRHTDGRPPVEPPTSTHTPTTDRDPRLSLGLLADVIQLLQQHGFALSEEPSTRNRAHADTLLAVYRLARAFEGEGDQ